MKVIKKVIAVTSAVAMLAVLGLTTACNQDYEPQYPEQPTEDPAPMVPEQPTQPAQPDVEL